MPSTANVVGSISSARFPSCPTAHVALALDATVNSGSPGGLNCLGTPGCWVAPSIRVTVPVVWSMT